MNQSPLGDSDAPLRPDGNGHNDQPAEGGDRAISEAVAAAMRYLDDPATALDIGDDAPPAVHLLLEAVAAARQDDIALEHLGAGELPIVIPALEDDPLAVALGIVPQRHTALSGAALKKARQRAEMKVSQLANYLNEAGHDVRAGQLQRWESASSVPIDHDLLTELATVLRVNGDSLLSSDEVAGGLALLPRFRALVNRWSTHTGLSRVAAQQFLLTRAAAPARRGTIFDEGAVLTALEVFVHEHEQRGSGNR